MDGSSRWDEREQRRQARREWKRQMRGDPNSLACAVRGPITLITLGVLFALQNFTDYGFGQTWPVLLIVFGLLSLLCRSTRREVPPPQYPAGPPPNPYQAPPAGSYRQSPYSQQPSKGAAGQAEQNPAATSTEGPTPGGGSI